MEATPSGGYLGSDGSRGDVRGAMLVMVVVVVRMAASPPVVLFVLLFLALGAALHGVRVGVRVAVRVAQRRGGGGQLLQGGVRGFHPNCCFAQQVDGVRQGGQNELKTLLRDDKFKSLSSWKIRRRSMKRRRGGVSK